MDVLGRGEPRRRGRHVDARSTSRRPAAAGPSTRAATGARRSRARTAARRVPRPAVPVRAAGAMYRPSPPSRDPAPLRRRRPGLPRPDRRRGRRHAARVRVRRPVRARPVARADAFPPLDQTKPFVLVDTLSLGLARLAAPAARSSPRTSGGWRPTRDGRRPSPPRSVRAPIERRRRRRPLGGHGRPRRRPARPRASSGSSGSARWPRSSSRRSASSSARRVSISERIGEFALLKALGLAPRQLLAVAVDREPDAAGDRPDRSARCSASLLAWLVLPFATLTSTGEPPVPRPVIVVPPEARLPTLVARRRAGRSRRSCWRSAQLPSARTSAVLRARDE